MGKRTESASSIPEWARQEREQDLSWLGENLHIFWPAAQQGFEQLGLGAIVIEVGTQASNGKGEGHPFVYIPSSLLEQQHWQDVMHLVKGYDPSWEFVAVLIKEKRESAYRIGIPEAKQQGKTHLSCE